MAHHKSLESTFDDGPISVVSAAEESTITGGFFSISNFNYLADYNASSGITTPFAVTGGRVNIVASGSGRARLVHRTQGSVWY